MRRRGRAARSGAVVLTVLFGAVTLAVPAAAAPTAAPPTGADDPVALAEPDPVTPDERAAALAEPAMVLVDVEWSGLVRDRATRMVLDPTPVTVSTACTGVGVGPGGYLVVTASCLAESSVANSAFQEVVDRWVAAGTIEPQAATAQFNELLATATLSSGGDDPSERTVTVRRAVTDDGPLPATVVVVADSAAGNAALLKLDALNPRPQPVLPLDGEIDDGDAVLALGCPATANGPIRPVSNPATVAQTEPRLVLTYQGATGSVLPGSVLLTREAEFVGLVDPARPEQGLLVDGAAVRELAEQSDIKTGLGQVDLDYRAGLDALYAGRYTESIELFDSVLAVIPTHRQAHGYRDQAQELRAAAGGDRAPTEETINDARRWIKRWSGLLVGLGVLAAILVFLLHRRHPHHPAAPPPPAPPVPPAPPAPPPPAS